MKVAIRDDDISFFTKPEALEHTWSNIPFPVTFAVTPFMVESEQGLFPGREFTYHQTGSTEHPLRLNKELVAYIRNGINSGRVSVALHGCNHRYKIHECSLIAEYMDDDVMLLKDKTTRAKKEIESLFGQKVDVFVPPDNGLSHAGLEAVAAAGIRFVQRAFPLLLVDTPLSAAWLRYYVKRLYWRLRYKIVYSVPFNNGIVVEAAGYLLKDSIPLERIIRDFEIYYHFNLPFTIATHYWELKNESLRNKLLHLLEYINSKPKINFCTLRDVFI